MKKKTIHIALMLMLVSFGYSQNTINMKNSDESVKTYPKTFSHIGITVPNIEEAVKFYTEVLGFYVIMEPTLVKEENETAIGQMCIDVFGEGWGTFKIAHLSTGDKIDFELFEFKESEELKPTFEPFRTGLFHFSIQDPDVEGLVKKIVDAGGKQRMPIREYYPGEKPYPSEIPKLTQEYFIDFHKKYYHPSNSYILLYGDASLNRELEFIDVEYLSAYEKLDEVIEIPKQKPFKEMKSAVKEYAVQEGMPTEAQTFLNISFVAGSTIDRKFSFSLDILSEALVNHESAPLRLALQEAGIGRDVSASMTDSQQNVFGITVKNANPEDAELFKEIVFSTLEKVSKEGFDKSMLEGIVNRMEFNLKQDDNPQKGIMCALYSYPGLYFADDPFLGLEYKKPLEEIKKGIADNLLAGIVGEHLLNNSHAVLLVLKPEAGLQAKIDAITAKELQAYKAGLNEEEIEKLIKETQELKEHQKREDSPEALATIPMLELSDIASEIEWFGVEEKSLADVSVLHHNAFTNNILYTKLYFDVRVLPKELIPYSKLLSYLLGKLGTENYNYGELDNALNINTGRFSTFTRSFYEHHSDDNLIPKFVVSAKATTEKTDKLFELTSEILNTSDFSDTDRLKELITRHQSRVDADIKNNGLNYALYRMMSYYSNSGMFSELTSGLEYYRFITDLSENFDENSQEILANLTKTADLLFAKKNAIGTVTCNEEDYASFVTGAEKFVGTLKDETVAINDWEFDFEKKNEGLLTASKVQYVVKGYNFKKLGYEYNGKMRVLNQIVSTDWLQNQVRVIGGAYGGFCGFSNTGNVYFASYCDPNLKETFENYDNTPTYLDEFEADEKLMTRYIIGTISRMDQPMTASQKGARAVQYYFEKTTPEELEAEREAVLSTTMDDIKAMKKMVEDVLSQDAICVYGNEEKVKENEALFGEVISLNE